MQQIVNARGAIRLFPAVRQIGLVIWSHYARVRRGDESAIGIESLRQLLKGKIARPLVIVGVSGNGHFAVALLSNRHARRHHVADVSLNVGINRVLCGSPNALHRLAKLFPVARFAKPVVAVDQRAGFRGCPAHRVSLISLATHDGAVARDGDWQMFVRTPLDTYGLVYGLRLHPLPLDAILIGSRRIERLDVKVLHVRAVVGESPRNAVVVADNHHRRARQGQTFDVPSGGREVHFIPDGRHHQLEMGVVRQKRFSCGRMHAADDPIVAAQSCANFSTRCSEKLLNR